MVVMMNLLRFCVNKKCPMKLERSYYSTNSFNSSNQSKTRPLQQYKGAEDSEDDLSFLSSLSNFRQFSHFPNDSNQESFKSFPHLPEHHFAFFLDSELISPEHGVHYADRAGRVVSSTVSSKYIHPEQDGETSKLCVMQLLVLQQSN